VLHFHCCSVLFFLLLSQFASSASPNISYLLLPPRFLESLELLRLGVGSKPHSGKQSQIRRSLVLNSSIKVHSPSSPTLVIRPRVSQISFQLSSACLAHRISPSYLLSPPPLVIYAFRQSQFTSTYHRPPFSLKVFRDHYLNLVRLVGFHFQEVCQKLGPSSSAETLLADADLWPRTSESALLSHLANDKVMGLAAPWKSFILAFAESIASLQRAERMLRSAKLEDYRTLCRELETPGREGWSSHKQPSWLLLEIENNITIRPLQAKVAIEMMSPTSGANSVMQLNMGEGKSSVIVPMLATALADGDRLVRIVVLKSLLQQTKQVLMQRLGGLSGHRICHIPFSRKTKISNETIEGISDLPCDTPTQFSDGSTFEAASGGRTRSFVTFFGTSCFSSQPKANSAAFSLAAFFTAICA
jgi:hypothetical protein